MYTRIVSVVLTVVLLAGVLFLPEAFVPSQAATVTGGTVTAVTDKGQVTALGTSLVQGKTIYSYDFWDGTRQPENAPAMKSANIMGQSSGVWESASAHTVLTDGDFYLKNELTFTTAAGTPSDAYYNGYLGACMEANPYQVQKNKSPLYAKTTAYQRFARYWADGDSYRMYFDLGKASNITDLLVASGVNASYLEVDTAATLTADQLAAKAATYDSATFLKEVKVYISNDLDTLYNESSMVFHYSGTAEESWANLYHLEKAVTGQYVGYKLGASASSHRAIAELGVYGDVTRDMHNGTTYTTVERVTDRAQVEALGDSLVSDMAWNSYVFWDGTSATHELRYANRMPENNGIWENGNAHEIVTDGDYYLPDELKFDRKDGELIGNTYQLANNKTPVYAQSTAYERFMRYWPAADSYRMFYTLDRETLISDIFVASGVYMTAVQLETAKAMTADELAAAEKTYDSATFARDIKVYISSDLDTLYNEENMAFSFCEDAEVERWAWANIYHLKEAQRGRFVGFQLGSAAGSSYRSVAEIGVYGYTDSVRTLGAQMRDENADNRTADMRFSFSIDCDNVSRNSVTYERILTADSMVHFGEKTYPLVDIGAVVAQGADHPDEVLSVEQADSTEEDGIVRVQARKLYDVTESEATFTVVVTGIPRRYYATPIRIRPFVVYRDGDDEVIAYGEEITRRVNHVQTGSEEEAVNTAKTTIENTLAEMEKTLNAAADASVDYVSITDYAHLVTNGIWTKALQTALNENENVYIPYTAQTYWIDSTVTVPSNRRILAHEEAVISLTEGCDVLMLRNEHTVDGTLVQPRQDDRDENIFIEGGIWKESRTKRQGYGKSGRYDNNRVKGNYYGISTCMLFNNINNLRLKNMTFANTAGFSVQVGELTNGVFENLYFDTCYADGVHINGNTENVVVRHLRGVVGDDLVALNMYDWQDSSVNFGPTRNMLVEDIVVPASAQVKEMRILPGTYYFQDGSSVDCAAENIIVRNLRGIRDFKMFFQTPVYTIGATPEKGSIGTGKNIFFEDIRINLDAPNHWHSSSMSSDPLRNPFGAFEINANIENIHFENIDILCNETTYPMANILHIGPLSCRNGDTEILDPYLSSKVDKITWENITYNMEPVEDLSDHVYTSEFDNINGDGMSTGKGEVGSIIKLYK